MKLKIKHNNSQFNNSYAVFLNGKQIGTLHFDLPKPYKSTRASYDRLANMISVTFNTGDEYIKRLP